MPGLSSGVIGLKTGVWTMVMALLLDVDDALSTQRSRKEVCWACAA